MCYNKVKIAWENCIKYIKNKRNKMPKYIGKEQVQFLDLFWVRSRIYRVEGNCAWMGLKQGGMVYE